MVHFSVVVSQCTLQLRNVIQLGVRFGLIEDHFQVSPMRQQWNYAGNHLKVI